MNLGWGVSTVLTISVGVKTYVPDTEDDPWCETGLPLGVLLNDTLHKSEQLGRFVLDLAINLTISSDASLARHSLRSA